MAEPLDAGYRKGFLVDPGRCLGCRACQVACKQWHKLSAEPAPLGTGAGEKPPDLTPALYNRIRFVERADGKGGVVCDFVSQRCLHCGDAGCLKVCPAPGALYRTREGAVAFAREKCIGCKYCVAACPFDVPRYDEGGRVAKCDLCTDRLEGGLAPACAKACPTQSLRFGPRGDLVARAKAAGKTLYGEHDLAGLGVVYALDGPPERYGLPARPTIPAAVLVWKDVVRPLGLLVFWGSVGALVLHYVTIGPKRVEEPPDGGEDAHG